MSRFSFASKVPFYAWLKRFFADQRSQGARKRRPSYCSLSLEGLETRLAPATFTQVGTILTIDLAANDAMVISTNAAGVYDMNLTAGTYTAINVLAPVTFSGIVTGNTGQLTPGGFLTQINIFDSGAGTSVTFNNSTQNYSEFFNIILDDATAGSGNVTFTAAGASTFDGDLTVQTNAGGIVMTNATITTNGNNVTLQTDTQNLVLDPTVLDIGGGGDTIITATAGNITFSSAGVTFGNSSATVTAGGAAGITQTFDFQFFNEANFIATNATGVVNLNNANNVFFGEFSASTIGNNDITVVNGPALDLTLADILMATGDLDVTVNGNITTGFNGETGRGIQTGGTATFHLTLANSSIFLDSLPNNIAGAVTIDAPAANLTDLFFRNAHPAAALPVNTGAGGQWVYTGNDLTNLTLIFDNANMPLPAIDIASTLNITAGGAITEAAPIDAVFATFTGLRSADITLTAANTIGTVFFVNPDADATADIEYTGAGAVALGGSNLGLGTFKLNANDDITQVGNTIQKRGGGTLTFNMASTGNLVDLSNAGNVFEGPVVITGGTVDTANLRNNSTLASLPTFPATVFDLTINFGSAPVVFPNGNFTIASNANSNLSVTGQGIYQQPTSAIVLPQTTQATFNAGNFPLILNNAGNDFPSNPGNNDGVRLINSGPNPVQIRDLNDIQFRGNTSIGNGIFTVTAGGMITEFDNAGTTISQAVNAGRTTFTAGAGGIILNFPGNLPTNNLRGILEFITPGNVDVDFSTGAILGTSTIGGTFTTNGSSLTQNAGATVSVTGASDFGNTVTLGNVGNTFTGTVAFNGGGGTNATLRDSGPVVIADSNIGGTLTIIAGGTITQSTPADAIVANAASFEAGINAITLSSPGNDFGGGGVSITSTGAGAVVINDTDDLVLNIIKLATGTFSATAGNGAATDNITQTAGGSIVQTGTANLSFTTQFAGADITLNRADNNFRGTVIATVNAGDITIVNKGDINLTGSTTFNALTLTAGGAVTLPAGTLTLTGNFNVSARQTGVADNITAGRIAFTGTTNITKANAILTATNDAGGGGLNPEIQFFGDVNVASSVLTLTLNLTNAAGNRVRLTSGHWNQGSNALTIDNTTGAAVPVTFDIVDANLAFAVPATFSMLSGTISMPDGGDLNVNGLGTFEVGGRIPGPPNPNTVTVDNDAGDINFLDGSTLIINKNTTGTGAPDKLVKAAGDLGNINLLGTVTLRTTGLAPAATSTILDAAAGVITGFFDRSVDPNASFAPVDFFTGSDIALATYNPRTLDIIRSGTVVTGGVFTDYSDDHDKFTVTASGGTGAGLVVLKDLNGDYNIVFRNASGLAATLTMTTSATPGDGRTTNVVGIAVNGSAPVTINAPTVDLGNQSDNLGVYIHVENRLTALNVGDINNDSGANTIIAGGTTAQTTTITGRIFTDVNIDLATILSSLNLKQLNEFLGSSTIEAERFGSVTVSGIPSLLITGDFSGTLVNRNAANSALPALTSANIAGQLSGFFDLKGNVGTINSKQTFGFTLGAAGANTNGLPGNVTNLNLGIVYGSVNILASGKISTISSVSWDGNAAGFDTIEANAIGTFKATGNTAIGNVGDISNIRMLIHGNGVPTALTSFSVAGNVFSNGAANRMRVIVENGNIGTIKVGRVVTPTGFAASFIASNSAITSITVGAWANGSTLDAKSLGTFIATGSIPFNFTGNFTGAFTLHGTPGSVANTLGTFLVNNDMGNSTIRVENGGIGSFTVKHQIGGTLTLQVLGAAGGKIGTFTAGHWNGGGSVTALSIGSFRITGFAATAISTLLTGDLQGVSMNIFRNTGTAVAIGTFFVKGNLLFNNNGVLRADNGITSFTVGRDISMTGAGSSLISVNNAATGSDVPGRISVMNVGRFGVQAARVVNLAANTLGVVNVKGYTQIEAGTTNILFGNLVSTTWSVRGAGLLSKKAIGTLTATGDMDTITINAPSGVSSVIVKREIDSSILNFENPAALTTATTPSGRINALTAGEISFSNIRANSIGTLKVIGAPAIIDIFSGLVGGFGFSDLTITGFTGATTAPVAMSLFSAAGILSSSTFNIRNTVASFTATQGISGVDAGIGFANNARLTAMKSGSIDDLDLVTRNLGSLTVADIATALFPTNSVFDSLFTITGAVGGVGIGTVNIKGTVDNSNFNVFSGNVTSMTVGAFVFSEVLVGFHALAANDLAQTTASADRWNATNFTLGTFKVTTPFNVNFPLSATFIDSIVVAARLGTVTLTGIDPTIPDGSDTITYGVAFRASGAAGTVTVANSATGVSAIRAPGYADGVFRRFPGLLG